MQTYTEEYGTIPSLIFLVFYVFIYSFFFAVTVTVSHSFCKFEKLPQPIIWLSLNLNYVFFFSFSEKCAFQSSRQSAFTVWIFPNIVSSHVQVSWMWMLCTTEASAWLMCWKNQKLLSFSSVLITFKASFWEQKVQSCKSFNFQLVNKEDLV